MTTSFPDPKGPLVPAGGHHKPADCECVTGAEAQNLGFPIRTASDCAITVR
jgi:hypothetical protein